MSPFCPNSKKFCISYKFSIFRLPTFAENFFVMDVITFESQAYRELVSKISTIAKFVVEHQSAETKNPEDDWVDSYEVCTFLCISERTLQRLRSKGMITYSLMGGKTYYTIGEIKKALQEKRIRSSEDALQNLINNHRDYVQQRRNTKADK